MAGETQQVREGGGIAVPVVGQRRGRRNADHVAECERRHDRVVEGSDDGDEVRDEVERHRKDPACASCHARIDGLGFALENFDVIGRWRMRDDGGEIDAAGKLAGGETFSGPQGLKNLLLSHSEEFVRGTVERLLTYALGRELEPRDQPSVRDIMRSTAGNRHRFSDLVLAIVKSVPFEMRQTQGQ